MSKYLTLLLFIGVVLSSPSIVAMVFSSHYEVDGNKIRLFVKGAGEPVMEDELYVAEEREKIISPIDFTVKNDGQVVIIKYKVTFRKHNRVNPSDFRIVVNANSADSGTELIHRKFSKGERAVYSSQRWKKVQQHELKVSLHDGKPFVFKKSCMDDEVGVSDREVSLLKNKILEVLNKQDVNFANLDAISRWNMFKELIREGDKKISFTVLEKCSADTK